MNQIKSLLSTQFCNKKRIFLRADLNVPTKNGQILDDFRLEQILPTINFIQKNGGKVILATHIDRPVKYDPNLSTKILINWFTKKGYRIDFEPDLNHAYKKSFENFDSILLLENLRFFDGEQKQDKNFAQQLSTLAEAYVNDAFSVSHRNDTSVTLLPQEFLPENRTIGLLFEKEINALNRLINPEHPFLLILGGAKIKDKIMLLDKLLDKVNSIILCPAIVFTFLKAQKKEVGKSLVDDSLIDFCISLLKKAEQKNVKIIFPIDYLVSHSNTLVSFDPAFAEASADRRVTFSPELDEVVRTSGVEKFNSNDIGVSIGPKSVELFTKEINQAKTIFFNGLFGDINYKNSLIGAKEIFDAMANSNAFTFIGGGDSVAAARLLGFENKVDYLSTGGGATLAYLSGQILSGLKSLH